ncbi:MAG: hypothetical protein GJ676_14595 [Rhodobacteraceae bacterium]|nr:hypothetical protein [Paracoccaceae bacterium]
MQMGQHFMDKGEILGASPGEYRVGVLALANDQVIERDLSLLLAPEILTFTTRIAFEGGCKLAELARMAPTLTEAARLLNPEVALDAVLFGCSSGTIAIGADRIREAVQVVSPDAFVVNPIDAACAAFERLGARTLNLVTPYEPEIADLMATTFTDRGFKIANRYDFGIVESADISRVRPEAIRTAALSLSTDSVEATFISCTDFQSLHVLASIEEQTGLPAVSSNQAMAWQIQDRSGVSSNSTDFGRLLSCL